MIAVDDSLQVGNWYDPCVVCDTLQPPSCFSPDVLDVFPPLPVTYRSFWLVFCHPCYVWFVAVVLVAVRDYAAPADDDSATATIDSQAARCDESDDFGFASG